jgi:hypothetical protein
MSDYFFARAPFALPSCSTASGTATGSIASMRFLYAAGVSSAEPAAQIPRRAFLLPRQHPHTYPRTGGGRAPGLGLDGEELVLAPRAVLGARLRIHGPVARAEHLERERRAAEPARGEEPRREPHMRDLRPSASGAARAEGRTHDARVLVLAHELGVDDLPGQARAHPRERLLRAGLLRVAEVRELGRVDARDAEVERAVLELCPPSISPLHT